MNARDLARAGQAGAVGSAAAIAAGSEPVDSAFRARQVPPGADAARWARRINHGYRLPRITPPGPPDSGLARACKPHSDAAIRASVRPGRYRLSVPIGPGPPAR